MYPGQLLAVALSGPDEPLVLHISAETGKIVRRMHSSGTRSIISCLGWGSNFVKPLVSSETQKSQEIFGNLKDTLSGKHLSEQHSPIDLPSELMFLDVSGLLSKLSVLSIGGKEWVLN